MTISPNTQKNVYVVLGMARSGTSAITRGLKALGVDLGDQLYRPDSRNPKGFYEDVDVVYKINRSILYHLDYPMSPTVVSQALKDMPLMTKYKQQAIKLLKQRFENTNHWGFKDPRNIILLPFWQEVFAELSLNQYYVITLRNPLASAKSSRQLTKRELEDGLLAWMLLLYAAISTTQGHKRIVVSYESMVADPKTQLERIKTQLDLQLSWNEELVSEYVNNFLDKKLQRHHFTTDDLVLHPAIKVLPTSIILFTFLQQLASDAVVSDSPTYKMQWSEIQSHFEKHYPMYSYHLKLLKEIKHLERELRTVRKSIPWKLIYPLRLIDDILRAFRKKTRDQEKLANANGQ